MSVGPAPPAARVGNAAFLGDTRQMAALVTGADVFVATGAGLIAALLLTVVVCTGLGAHRRGCGVPLSVVAALAFPLTWTVWYVVDEDLRPRRTKRAA